MGPDCFADVFESDSCTCMFFYTLDQKLKSIKDCAKSDFLTDATMLLHETNTQKRIIEKGCTHSDTPWSGKELP